MDELREGYKKTDIGIIPLEWEAKRIGDHAVFEGGAQPPRKYFSEKPQKGYMRLIQIRDYKTDEYATYIPKEMARKFCNKDDVMIGRYGPPIFQILRGLEGAYNVALMKAIPDSNIDNEFLYYFLQQESLFNLIDRLSQRTSGQTGVDKDALLKYPLPLPTLKEQQKISQILSIWDEAIYKTEKLMEDKKLQKKGLTQRLLMGKTRFKEFVKSNEYIKTKIGLYPKDWVVTNIGQCITNISKKNKDTLVSHVVSVTKYNGIVDSKEYFDRQVHSKDLSNYKIIRKNEFAYSTIHLDEGSIGYLKHEDIAILSPMYTVFKIDEDIIDKDYLYYLLKTHKYMYIYNAIGEGTVDRRSSISFSNFSKISIALPSLEEQQKIINVISTVDKEINLLEQKLQVLKEQKKGLMNNLLTGKVRVKV